jgi:gas vesicle protein
MNNSFKIVFALLVVTAIGGFAGILLAPDKGSKTRAKLVKKGKDILESTKETAESIVEKTTGIVESVIEEGGKIISAAL